MCCLAYENDMYSELRRELPRVGRTISTPQGDGVVRAVQIIGKRVKVQLQNDELIDFHISELEPAEAPSEGPDERPRRNRRGGPRSNEANDDAPSEELSGDVSMETDEAAEGSLETDEAGGDGRRRGNRRRRSRSRGGRRRRPDGESKGSADADNRKPEDRTE